LLERALTLAASDAAVSAAAQALLTMFADFQSITPNLVLPQSIPK
jgi:hypothetical protein